MFGRFIALIAGFIVGIVIFVDWAASETLTLREGHGGEAIIQFEGEYTRGSGQRLYDLARATGAKYVEFNSPGGLANEGYIAHDVMGILGLNAVIREGDMCMSACAITVMGAESVDIQGILGFHPAWVRGNVKDAFKEGQLDGMKETFFMTDLGVSRQFIRAMMYLGGPEVFAVFTNTNDYNRIFVGDFTSKEIADMFWTVQSIRAYIWLENGGNLND